MTAPGRWCPSGVRPEPRVPEPGELLAYQHAVWRVIEVNPIPEDLWSEQDHTNVRNAHRYPERAVPRVVVVRPVHITTNDVRARDHDRHLKHQKGTWWFIYPNEHYPVCATCGEPLPCRELAGMQAGQAAVERMTRYENPGVCPACQKIITRRQQSITFDENLELPGGPPVTFHTRAACFGSAMRYEQRWARAAPGRRTRLSCPGHMVTHNDGTYECSSGDACSGPDVEHQAYRTCSCPDCHARGAFTCRPSSSAARRASDLFGEAS